jgi:hypothetical protein
LSLLEAGKLVMRTKTQIVIRYRRFRATFGDQRDDEKAIEAAIDHTKYGLIREISRGMSKTSEKKPRVVRGKKVRSDAAQQLLNF